MAAFFKRFAPPGRRLAVVRAACPAPAPAVITCIWETGHDGRLVRRWRSEGDGPGARLDLAA